LPDSIRLPRVPSSPLVASLRYTAFEPAESRLPLELKRTLYRLETPTGEGDNKADGMTYKAVPVAPGEALSSAALYVDEITLNPKRRMQYGLLEVPLPPGGTVEGAVWGIRIAGLEGDGKGEATAFEAPEFEMGALGYHVPLARIEQPTVTRQLVRFLQRGQFALPPARYFRMYQPNDKAYEQAAQTHWQVR
jgi:uncharacterized protein YfaS (alpha-2-macroglobulin family)